MYDVSVVIPNYNGIKYLEHCLEALENQREVAFETIIVDNCSQDGSASLAKEKFPQCCYLSLDQNYGFCRAVNEGIKKAAAPFVVLLNNDTEVEPEFLKNLLDCISKDERIFSVEARMMQYHRRELIDSAGTSYSALGWASANGKDKTKEEFLTSRKVFAACAGAAIYRKSVFEEIGYFDEEHFAYLEDIDIGYRARIHGYYNVYEPSAVVYHVGSGTSGSRHNEFKVKYSSRNNVYLIYKNMPLLQILLNSPFLLIGFLTKTIFFTAKGFGKTYVKGLAEGVRLSRNNREKKIVFQRKNFGSYWQIQKELWKNLLVYFQ